MSSLNMDELYQTINSKKLKRYETYDSILKKVHTRIKYNARLEQTFCFFQIPEFIFGVPLYNVRELKHYIVTSLKKNKFELLLIEPNWLFISWESSNSKKQVSKPKQIKKQSDYKTIGDYKPSGQFVSNDIELQNIKEKSFNLLDI
jgi:hypothetical protein